MPVETGELDLEDDTIDQKIDGATSMFLVFDTPNEATFAISDNRAWITAVLRKRGYDCNDFSVERPAAEIAAR
jgi:hypothetical protein